MLDLRSTSFIHLCFEAPSGFARRGSTCSPDYCPDFSVRLRCCYAGGVHRKRNGELRGVAPMQGALLRQRLGLGDERGDDLYCLVAGCEVGARINQRGSRRSWRQVAVVCSCRRDEFSERDARRRHVVPSGRICERLRPSYAGLGQVAASVVDVFGNVSGRPGVFSRSPATSLFAASSASLTLFRQPARREPRQIRKSVARNRTVFESQNTREHEMLFHFPLPD